MAYPDYPNNRLIVDGIDLTENFGMILVDGYSLEPPSPKTYIVDIPGGNGSIDLTSSISDDVVYENRNQEFTFYLINVENFEEIKTQVTNFLHGKAFDYKITMDPEYTYHGRFSVSSYAHAPYSIGIVGVITIKVVADPYKYRDKELISTDTSGGKILSLNSGRKPVRPVFETDGSIKIEFGSFVTELPAGTWTVNDIVFKEGSNQLYLRSMENQPTVNWTYFSSKTWSEVGQKRWFEWMFGSDSSETITQKTWGDVDDMTWASVSAYRWSDLSVMHTRVSEEAIVYIQYDWSDL